MTLISVSQEFVAVRVQDPRIQNEGSWNSYVDYKIFLHVSINTLMTTCQVTFSVSYVGVICFRAETVTRLIFESTLNQTFSGFGFSNVKICCVICLFYCKFNILRF